MRAIPAESHKRIWPSVLSITVVTTIGAAVVTSGYGLLSMSPPAVKLAYVCFSFGYLILFLRISWWAAFECANTRVERGAFIGFVCLVSVALWFYSVSFARSRSPVLLNLKFESFTTAVGNLPDRALVTTWNGEGWSETNYADVRLRIDNVGDKLENLDLNIKLAGDQNYQKPFYVLPAIGQTTQLPGVEFIPPQSDEVTVHLGKDALPITMRFGKGWSVLPPPSIRVIVPQLLDGQHLTLILGTSYSSQPADGSLRRPPPYFEITGTGDALIGGSTRQGIVEKQRVEVRGSALVANTSE